MTCGRWVGGRLTLQSSTGRTLVSSRFRYALLIKHIALAQPSRRSEPRDGGFNPCSRPTARGRWPGPLGSALAVIKMKINRLAFNIVGLIIAGLCAFAALSTLFVVLPGAPPKAQGWWYFMAASEAIAALTLGGGGMVNIAKGRRLAPWPTAIMILGYLVMVWLLPLALWGVISLILERKHRQKETGGAQQTRSSEPSDGALVDNPGSAAPGR